MTTEFWLVGAAALLAVAILARVLALFGPQRRWKQLAMGARAATVPVMLAALVSALGWRELWPASPALLPLLDFRQMALSLAVAALLTYLVLVWRLASDAGSPIVDLLILGLVLAGLLWRRPVATLPLCPACPIPVEAQWFLFHLGGGATVVAGGAGLTLAARSASAGGARALAWPPRIEIHVLLKRATAWALVTLGAGLAVSIWWAWRTWGSLTSENVPAEWLAVVWLLAAMSMLARRTGPMGLRWAAGLAIAAAGVTVLSVLA